MAPLRASHSSARPARRSVRIEEPASSGNAWIQATRSSASRSESATPCARHGGAFVSHCSGDVEHVAQCEDLGRAAGQRHNARDGVDA
jgi:hypothetical protein